MLEWLTLDRKADDLKKADNQWKTDFTVDSGGKKHPTSRSQAVFRNQGCIKCGKYEIMHASSKTDRKNLV